MFVLNNILDFVIYLLQQSLLCHRPWEKDGYFSREKKFFFFLYSLGISGNAHTMKMRFNFVFSLCDFCWKINRPYIRTTYLSAQSPQLYFNFFSQDFENLDKRTAFRLFKYNYGQNDKVECFRIPSGKSRFKSTSHSVCIIAIMQTYEKRFEILQMKWLRCTFARCCFLLLFLLKYISKPLGMH